MKIDERFQDFEGYDRDEENCTIKLDKNESPFDLPDDMKNDIFEELKKIPLNRYPPLHKKGLKKKIASHIGYSEEYVMVGNGSDALLPLVFELFDSDRVVINSPTFSMYSFYARRNGSKVVDIPLDEDFEIGDVSDGIRKPGIICICSPNSPTGNLQPRDKIIDILETGNLVVLDEAYIEFSKKSYLDLIEEYDNLIVLRTLSKAFGLAGLRLGYAVASPERIDHLNRIRSPFNTDVLSTEIAKKVFDAPEIVEKNIDKIVNERERIIDAFESYAYPSDANFVLLDLDAYDYLRKKDISVRKMKGRLEGMIRVTVGKKNENDMLIEALQDFLGK